MKKITIRLKIFLTILLLIIFISLYIHTQSLIHPAQANISFTNGEPEYNTILRKRVYLSGEIQKPGVYEIGEDMRIADLISQAGGFTKDADQVFITKDLNLASKLVDEQQIYIPSNKILQRTENVSNKSELINLNSASSSELESLPGIGKATAQSIIQARPYMNVQDLLKVKGIGEAKLSAIIDLVTVE